MTPARSRAQHRPGETGGFERLGRFAARRRWWIVGSWAILLLIALPLATRTGGALRSGGFIREDLESARAKALLRDEIGVPQAAVAVVFYSPTLRAGEPAFEAAAARAVAAVPKAAHVIGVVSHGLQTTQVSTDRHTAYDVVYLDLLPDDSPQALPGLRAALVAVPEIQVGLAGGPAFYGDVQAVSESDLRRSELISLPLAGLALLLVFGSAVAAALPLAVGGAAVLAALAAIGVVASATPMSIFVLNLATLLGLGLGVDYSLLMTSRFREELRARGVAGERPDAVLIADAVGATMATAGRAVFFSGLTVLLGLLGLVLFEFMILRSVGIAGAVVVGFAVLAALTLLPALLAISAPHLDRLRIRRVRLGTGEDGPWARLANRVMDRPVAVLVPTLGLLLVLGLPFLHVRFNAPDSSILPPTVPSRQAFDRLTTAFGPGPFAPIVLAIRTDGPATSPANLARIYAYSRELAADPRIVRVDGLVDIDPRIILTQYQLMYGSPSGPPDRGAQTALAATTHGDLTAFTITTHYGPNEQPGRDLVRDMRAGTNGLAPPAGLKVLVGGGAADVEDVVAGIAADFPRTAGFILVSTYLVLLVLLRSAILPLKALVMNTLSITASFGALVWIFQDGNLSALLGTRPLGFVETTQPVILFCVLFGLSMDYEVFLLTRMRETWDRTGDNRAAVAHGLERSGRIVTSAALIVVVVAGSFAFADIVLIKALGLGIAIAVALDATVVRALLVPATMRLLGDWNWWLPKRLARHLPPLGVAVFLVALVVAGCSGGPILANPTIPAPVLATATPTAVRPPDPQPIQFPRDDGPHDRLTEWWYYTGHLRDDAGGHWGFEFVVFRAERGTFPVTWASHLALTDEAGHRFVYAQRGEVGPGVDSSPAKGPAPIGFALAIEAGQAPGSGNSGAGASTGTGVGAGAAWQMDGRDGVDHLVAAFSPAEAAAAGLRPDVATGFDLSLTSAIPPALHARDGWIDFGPAGGSYYYSRTRMAATGSLTVEGRRMTVDGTAWFDHQWGDFVSVGGGGWDWFAVNLADGTDVTVSEVRAADGSYPLVYGTLVDAAGAAHHLDRTAFTVVGDPARTWASPLTGTTWPAGWTLQIPGYGLVIDLTPTVAAQELDTRASTGVIYWEGSQVVRATQDGLPVAGQAYVELTGYARPGG
jgi:RND superfamily putative drug exporter